MLCNRLCKADFGWLVGGEDAILNQRGKLFRNCWANNKVVSRCWGLQGHCEGVVEPGSRGAD